MISNKNFLSAFVLTFFYACAPSDRALSIAELEGSITLGRASYDTNCALCHGTEGRGGRGPNLVKHLKHHDDAEFIDMIIEGGGVMPSYASKSDQEIADLMAYIKTL